MTIPNTSATGGFLAPLGALPVYDLALTQAVGATVAGITGLDRNSVRPRWQPKPPAQPPKASDWCALGATNIEWDDNPSIVHNSEADGGLGTSTMYIGETLSLMASFFGPNSSAMTSRLKFGLQLSQNQEAMLEFGLVYKTCGIVTNASELINEEWVGRYDLPFVIVRRAAYTYATRNLVEIDGRIVIPGQSVTGTLVDVVPIEVTR